METDLAAADEKAALEETLGLDRCIKQFVHLASKNAKYRLNQQKAEQSIVKNVMQITRKNNFF